MRPFVRETGIAAPLAIANIDTDQIIPSRFLKGVTRDGLGRGLFAAMRYCPDGSEDAGFVLNRAPWREARFLVARENFGCGSSREHAPWALAGFGIRAVLAPSFGDIFANNCVKNGLLPAMLAAADLDPIIAACSDPANAKLTVDLEAQRITNHLGEEFAISIDSSYRQALLEGRDEITRSLQHLKSIEAFEEAHLSSVPAIPALPEWPLDNR
jgi:3-isopropylmalate/(R)-2-methylmalate dehydratase small subunit